MNDFKDFFFSSSLASFLEKPQTPYALGLTSARPFHHQIRSKAVATVTFRKLNAILKTFHFSSVLVLTRRCL